MGDQSEALSTLSAGKRQPLRIGGCIGVFTQLFDWNRVLGSKPFATRFLVPEVPNSPLHRSVVNEKRALARPVQRRQRNHAANASPNRQRASPYERKESLQASAVIGLNPMAGISFPTDVEAPREVRQLQELLHVRQEPFVLQDLLQEKKLPLRKPRPEIKIRACMKCNQNGQAKKPPSLKKIKLNDSRKHRVDVGQQSRGLKQSKPASQRSMSGPPESIVATPPSQVRSQLKSMLSPTKSTNNRITSPLKSPVKSPNKKALLMEAAAKILEASSRSRKPLSTVRSLLIEMDSRHAKSEMKSSKKPSKAKPMQKSSDRNAYPVQPKAQSRAQPKVLRGEKQSEHKKVLKQEKKRISPAAPCPGIGLKNKQSCGSSDDVRQVVGNSSGKKLGQRQEKDCSSQSRVFPYDRSLNASSKSSATLASPSLSGQEGGASSQQKVGIHLLYGRFFGSGKEKKHEDGNDTKDISDKGSSLRSFLWRKATSQVPAAGNVTGRVTRTHKDGVVPDIACVKHVLPNRKEIGNRYRREDAVGIPRLQSGPWVDVGGSPRLVSGVVTGRAEVSKEDLPAHGLAIGGSFSNASAIRPEPLKDGKGLLQTDCCDECKEPATSDSNFGEVPGQEEDLSGDMTRVEPGNCLYNVPKEDETMCITTNESSTDPSKAIEIGGQSRDILSEAGMSEMRTPCIERDEDHMSVDSCSSICACLLTSKDGDEVPDRDQQSDLHESTQLNCSVIITGGSCSLKLCNFSWWEKEDHCLGDSNVEEQDLEDYRCSRKCDEKLPQATEENTIKECAGSPPFLLKVFGEDRDDSTPEGEPPTASDFACLDDFQQCSPVSVLDAAFEEDSPNLDKSLAIFQEAKQQLLDNVRRYEMLAQMDIDMLIKYAESDSFVKDEDEEEEEEEEEELSSCTAFETTVEGEADADITVLSSQCRVEISALESHELDSLWERGEEEVEEEELEHYDQSSIWHSDDPETNPELYSDLETQDRLDSWEEAQEEEAEPTQCTTTSYDFLERFKKGERLRCKIFFDCVNEALESVTKPLVGAGHYIVESHAWTGVPKDLLQEIERPIISLASDLVDALLERDMGCARSKWRDLSKEVDEIGTEIESTIFGVMMQELLAELMEDL